jgi:M6 family metalloprotease-like protein
MWTLTPWPDGTYLLTNDFTGPGTSLDTSTDTHDPWLNTGDHTGQHWTLTGAGPVPGTVPIPALDPKTAGQQNEGPTDFTRFARPQGVVKAVMIFVDFPDAPAGTASAAATADRLLGSGQAQQLYRDQSYGQLTLDVTVRSDLGWRRLPKPSTSYNLTDFDSQQSYISAAAALFHPAEIKFSDYQMVFVVAADTLSPGFQVSPAFTPLVGSEAMSPSGKIRLAVTLGHDSYTNRYITLVHEIGHLFGLPDLYVIGESVEQSEVGCWEIMCDIFHSVSFLGWHRHKNGWLPATRATYLKESTQEWYATLSPLSGSCGLSLIALPIDDVNYPSKIFVVELAQPVLGSNGQYWGDGVLIYTVDASINTGNSPVVIIPNQVSDSDDYGHLYQAPYGIGDVARTRLRVGLAESGSPAEAQLLLQHQNRIPAVAVPPFGPATNQIAKRRSPTLSRHAWAGAQTCIQRIGPMTGHTAPAGTSFSQCQRRERRMLIRVRHERPCQTGP